MRNLHHDIVNRYRDCSRETIGHYGWTGDQGHGAFNVPSPIDGSSMRAVASVGDGWDHVSVSRRTRCPNWTEMEHVKRLFFRDDETAMQLHVPPSEHISFHPYTLHLWRPHRVAIPRPPAAMVALAEEGGK